MTRAPFKLLDFYCFEDADLFFGREEETRRMVGEILSTRLLALFSPSGSGKTSLINAGVRPQLEKMGYKTIYTRLEDAPISSICRAVSKALQLNAPPEKQPDLHGFLKQAAAKTGKPLVIFLDQFEEFFLAFRNRPEIRRDFIAQLAQVKYDDDIPVFLVLALREDYFANLHEFREAIPSIFQNNANTRLQPFSDEQARRAIEEPIKTVGWTIEYALIDALITDLKKGGEGIEPIALQLVCGTLCGKIQIKESKHISLALYKACGGADKILQNFIDERLNTVPRWQQPLMARILDALKTPENTKRILTFADLKKELKIKREQRLETVLEKLAGLGILRREDQAGTRWYEFKHDYLAPRIAAWLQQRREKKMRRRLRFAFFIFPGIILFLVVCTYLFIQYNTFYAGFSAAPENKNQQKEIVISRGFNPFNWSIGTGFLRESDLNETARKVIEARFRIGAWNRDDWTKLAGILNSPNVEKILYLSGKKREGIENILRTMKNYNVKDAAGETTAALAEVYPDVIDELLKILGDKTNPLRRAAAYSLGEIGQGNEQAIASLFNALKDEDLFVRKAAAEALGKISQGNAQAIIALINALKDEWYDVRNAAAYSLGEIGAGNEQAIAGLINALKDKESYVRIAAAAALGKIGSGNKQAIAGLIKALQDNESYVRIAAAAALGKIGSGNKQAIAGLLNALKNKDEDVRRTAAKVLGKIGQGNEQAIAGLIKALKDKVSYVREAAAEALGKIGQGNEQAIAGLLNALKNKDEDVRRTAAKVLGKIGKGNDQAIAGLIKALQDNEGDVREATAEALGEIGAGNGQAIASLINVLKDKDEDVRIYAAEALRKIDASKKQGITGLLNELKDRFSFTDSEAAAALGKLLEKKPDQELLAMLRHHDSKDRIAAAHALAQKTKLAKSTLAEIKRLVKDENEPIWARLSALDCIELILAKEKEKE